MKGILSICLLIAVVSAIPIQHIPGLYSDLHKTKGSTKHSRDFHYHNEETGEFYRLKYDAETHGDVILSPRLEDGVDGLLCHKSGLEVMISFKTEAHADAFLAEAKGSHVLNTVYPVECESGNVLIRITSSEKYGPRMVRIAGRKLSHFFELFKHLAITSSTNMMPLQRPRDETTTGNESRPLYVLAEKEGPLPQTFFTDPVLHRRTAFEGWVQDFEKIRLAQQEKEAQKVSAAAKGYDFAKLDEKEREKVFKAHQEELTAWAKTTNNTGKALHHTRAMETLNWGWETKWWSFGIPVGIWIDTTENRGPGYINLPLTPPQALQEKVTSALNAAVTVGPVTVKLQTQFSYTVDVRIMPTSHFRLVWSDWKLRTLELWLEHEWYKRERFGITIKGSLTISKEFPLPLQFSQVIATIPVAYIISIDFTFKVETSIKCEFSFSTSWSYTKLSKSVGWKKTGFQYGEGRGWSRVSEKTGPTSVPWQFDKVFHHCSAFGLISPATPEYRTTSTSVCAQKCMDNGNCKVFRMRNGYCELSNLDCGTESWGIPVGTSFSSIMSNIAAYAGVTSTFKNLRLPEPQNGWGDIEVKMGVYFVLSIKIEVSLSAKIAEFNFGGPYLTFSVGVEYSIVAHPLSRVTYNPAPWVNIAGGLKHVSSNTDGTLIVGVAQDDAIYYRNGLGVPSTGWKLLDGRLRQIAVSGNGQFIVGVNSIGQIYYRKGVSGSWIQIPGALKHIAINNDGTQVWGVNNDDVIYYSNGLAGAWRAIDGRLKVVSVSGDGNHIWGCNANNDVYYRNGVSGGWQLISGKLKYVHVNNDNTLICGVNSADAIYCRYGLTNDWQQVDGGLKQIVTSGDGTNLWGVNSGNAIYQKPVGVQVKSIVPPSRDCKEEINFVIDISLGVTVKVEFDILKGLAKITLFETTIVAVTLFNLKITLWRRTATLDANGKVISQKVETIDGGNAGSMVEVTVASWQDAVLSTAPTPPSGPAPILLGHHMEAEGITTAKPVTKKPTKAPGSDKQLDTSDKVKALHAELLKEAQEKKDKKKVPTQDMTTPGRPMANAPMTSNGMPDVPGGRDKEYNTGKDNFKQYLANYTESSSWTGACDSSVFVYRVRMQYLSKERFILQYDIDHGKHACTLKGLYKVTLMDKYDHMTMIHQPNKAFDIDTCWMQDVPAVLKLGRSLNGGYTIYNRWGYCGDISLRMSSSLTLMKPGQSLLVEQSLATPKSRLTVQSDGNVELVFTDTNQQLWSSNTISPIVQNGNRLRALLRFNESGELIIEHRYDNSDSVDPAFIKVIGGAIGAQFLEITDCDVRMYGGSASAPDKSKLLWVMTNTSECDTLVIEKPHPKWHRGGAVLHRGEVLRENAGLYSTECVFEHEFGRAHIVPWDTLKTSWSTAANETLLRRDTAVFTLLFNGNLALIDKTGAIRWQSGTAGSGASYAALEGCMLVLYKEETGKSPKAIWSANGNSKGTYKATAFKVPQLRANPILSSLPKAHMEKGDFLLPGQSVISRDAILVHQPDGNVVLYARHGTSTEALWSTNTAGRCTVAFAFTHDGNLGLYACSNTANSENPQIWATGPLSSRPEMVGLADDCTLSLYAQAFGGTFNPASLIKTLSTRGCPADVAMKTFKKVEQSLSQGQRLIRGQAMYTNDRGLLHQPNGDIVFFQLKPQTKVLWRSGTNGKCTKTFGVENNNVILVGCDESSMWSALPKDSPKITDRGVRLVLGDKSFTFENAKNKAVWTSAVTGSGASDKGEGEQSNNNGAAYSMDGENTSQQSTASSPMTVVVMAACVVVGVIAVVAGVVFKKKAEEATEAGSMLSP